MAAVTKAMGSTQRTIQIGSDHAPITTSPVAVAASAASRLNQADHVVIGNHLVARRDRRIEHNTQKHIGRHLHEDQPRAEGGKVELRRTQPRKDAGNALHVETPGGGMARGTCREPVRRQSMP